jgi:hypothetical protein
VQLDPTSPTKLQKGRKKIVEKGKWDVSHKWRIWVHFASESRFVFHISHLLLGEKNKFIQDLEWEGKLGPCFSKGDWLHVFWENIQGNCNVLNFLKDHTMDEYVTSFL